jgi:ABC-type glycerol-3-phosphate transport system substrate-binding protein
VDSAYPLNQGFALQELEDQWQAFNLSQDRYQVTLRPKASTGEGSLVNSVLATQAVAPQALPHLILIPYQDLYPLIQAGLLRPLGDWLPDELLHDLWPSALTLGEWQGALYGLPYLLEVQHLFYAGEGEGQSFEALWAGEAALSLNLPLQAGQVPPLVLAQYLAAGGGLQDEEGRPRLDEGRLREVLAFYADSLAQGRLTPVYLESLPLADYWQGILDSPPGLALTSSTLYLQNTGPGRSLSLPGPSGAGRVILGAWVWAITSTDPNLQLGAGAFVEWLLQTENQTRYSQSLQMLPASPASLAAWEESDYRLQVQEWLLDPVVLPLMNPAYPSLLQLEAAWAAILEGQGVEAALRQAENLAEELP